MKIYILLIALVFASSTLAAERVTNRQGTLITEGIAVLGMLEKYVVPAGWSVYFEDDDYRSYSVEWSEGINWHDAMNSFGNKLHLSVIIDGATKKVYFHAPSSGFSKGVHVLNSASLAYSANRELQDILRRGEVNYQRYESKALHAQIAEAEVEKAKVARMLDDLESQRVGLERDLAKFELVSKKVPLRVEEAVSHQVAPSANPKVNAPEPMYEHKFEVFKGLVIADNMRRFADSIGYQLHLVNVPRTCDFEAFVDETIKGKDRLKMFRDYASKYYFDVTFHEPEAEKPLAALNYIGDRNVFKGCSR